MAINTTGKNVMLDALGTACTHMALYSDIAGTTEITGGSYARKPITWNPAASGSKSVSGSYAFDVPAGAQVQAIGVCTALTGGTQHAFDDVIVESFGGAGTYTVTAYSVSLT
jgi:hypothetical protein